MSAYQVIARKWRPQTFEEVTGQEHITRTLRNAIEHERVASAYLFSGARGVGKTTTARLFAKALNCHKADRPTPTPCRTTDADPCASCAEIAEGRSIDVLEIDAASNTGVDNVRAAVIGNVGVRPARDRYKVFIIDEVHMLSGAAFNALLKTLEEPPPRVVFIMATTESHKVPDTILSRCQQFEFRTIATAKIAERLRAIADAEKISVADDALREIARAGEGSMRDAQSAFDQVISFSEGKITGGDVEAALGLASAEMLARVGRAIANNQPAEALAVVDDLVMRGHDLRNFCRDLLVYFRNLLVVKVGGGGEMLDATEAEARELQGASRDFSEADLVRFFHSLSETESNLRASAHPRYQLEIGLIKLIEMRRLTPLQNIIERLGALETAIRTGKTPALATTGGGSGGASGAPPAANPAGGRASSGGSGGGGAAKKFAENVAAFTPPENKAPVLVAPIKPVASPVSSPVAAPPALSLVTPPRDESFETDDDAGDDWESPAPPQLSAGGTIELIKEGLEKRKRPFLVIAIEGASRVRLEGNELSIRFAPEAKHLRDALMKPESVKLLREVGREVTGHDLGVRVTTGAGEIDDDDAPPSAADEARQEKQSLRALAEQHPTVQHFLRTFRGEIIDVRRVDAES